jgi:hypothetical protein
VSGLVPFSVHSVLSVILSIVELPVLTVLNGRHLYSIQFHLYSIQFSSLFDSVFISIRFSFHLSRFNKIQGSNKNNDDNQALNLTTETGK